MNAKKWMVAASLALMAWGAHALQISHFSPQGEVARVRQMVVKFDAAAASLIWAIARIRFSFCFNCLRRGAAVWFRLEIAVSRSSMVFREWAFR